jgi:hypothetical protein
MKGHRVFSLLAVFGLCLVMLAVPAHPSVAAPPIASKATAGLSVSTGVAPIAAPRGRAEPTLRPDVSQPVKAAVWNGDLRDLPQLEQVPDQPTLEVPRPGVTGKPWPAAPTGWSDPVTQTQPGQGQMPSPIANFAGMSRGEAGGWIPPDTNGDVGPTLYLQAVNVAFGIFDKITGAPVVKMTFDALFNGTGTSCDNANRGDIIGLYDHLADRWILTDFSLPSGGPYLQCVAISQTGDPVSGGWYFYAFDAGNPNGAWHDYPKMTVWPDAYYMSANMFDPWSGAKVWALDRAAMLDGQPLTVVSFDAGVDYGSLLPSNLEGPEPPAGSPAYFASIWFPDTVLLWQFHVDWDNPGESTFTGPVGLTVASFGYIGDIVQPSPGEILDSLGDRLMFSLQYRNFGTHESLWVNHTVLSGDVAGVRWYEVRDPGGTPTLFQQGTYQPDNHFRWMGSVAADQDGNMALGYSISSSTLKPAIRYAGRLYGEIPGTLPQNEVSLVEGTGVQVGGGSRWGDYSAMTIDPVDDCTFWYTQEYHLTNGSNWQTRIGSFKFPSCGVPKGWITGTVYNVETMAGVAGAPVTAVGTDVTLTVETDANGQYSMTLPEGAYALTAGPLLPGYPDPVTVQDVPVTAGSTTEQDIPLAPVPYLVEGALLVDDNVPGGNNNGYPEPGETGLLLWEGLTNAGAGMATNVAAHLIALTTGVSVTVADAAYPDIAPGEAQTNGTPFEFSIDPSVTCGAQLDFEKTIATDQGSFTTHFSLYAKVPLPPATPFFDDMENGPANWTTGGTNNSWAITTEQAHSPSHAWSDSPGGDYLDNTNSWLRSPILDLSGTTDVSLSFWHRYSLENGWDYGNVEYSLDGGTTWQATGAIYTGLQDTWTQQTLALPALAGQSQVAFRFRLQSDGGVTDDGWYIDDVALSYVPFACYDPVIPTGIPSLVAPLDNTVSSSPEITFVWQPGAGGMPAGYDLELDGTVVTSVEPTWSTTLTPGLHTWRVRAFNSLGYSDYSEPWTLTVQFRVLLPLVLRSR